MDLNPDYIQTPHSRTKKKKSRMSKSPPLQTPHKKSYIVKKELTPANRALCEDILSQLTTPTNQQCNCKQSKCLQLYCDCFRQGKLCGVECGCTDCGNHESNEDTRFKVMIKLMNRNKEAFTPKINETKSRHFKGCNCKNSGCSKRYCECFMNEVKCNEHCQCKNCNNRGQWGKRGRKGEETMSRDSLNKKLKV